MTPQSRSPSGPHPSRRSAPHRSAPPRAGRGGPLRRATRALTVLAVAVGLAAAVPAGAATGAPTAATPATTAPAAPVTPAASGMAATPYMGWSSWSMQSSGYPGLNPDGNYSYLTEANVLKQTDALAAKLKPYGYDYVNIDAGWWMDDNWTPGYDQYGRQTPDPVRFPDGMKAVADHIHAKGLKAGIYLPVNRITEALPAHGSRLFTVKPGTPLATTGYEAESAVNTLSGNASVTGCDACSGGEKVGNLYLGGKLRFNDITVQKDGIYTVNVAYVSGDPRSATVSSNAGNGTGLEFPSTGDWGTVDTVSVQLALKAGPNTITFDSGSGGYAPDIDRIDVPRSL